MRKTIASAALIAAFSCPASAFAQGRDSTGPRSGLGSRLFGGGKSARGLSANPTAGSAGAPERGSARDAKVYRAGEELPAPAMIDPNSVPAVSLPTEPIEPYLLCKDNGPFMVLAHTFRGPDAAKYAQMLTMELRQVYQLPAYVYYLKMKPGQSNIRGVQPTAEEPIRSGVIEGKARLRMYDEAAVLVGDCATTDEAQKLWRDIKKIRPTSLEKLPNPYVWRVGLKSSMITTNPYQPAQRLYAGAPLHSGDTFDPMNIKLKPPPMDPLIRRMNKGPRSLFNCPGAYSLVVAEFVGRSQLNPDSEEVKRTSFLKSIASLKDSPLQTAAADAYNIADQLVKNPVVVKLGLPVYVYHDRTSSKVLVGSFQTEGDPAAAKVREAMADVEIVLKRVNHGYDRKLGKENVEATLGHLAPNTQLMRVPRP